MVDKVDDLQESQTILDGDQDGLGLALSLALMRHFKKQCVHEIQSFVNYEITVINDFIRF